MTHARQRTAPATLNPSAFRHVDAAAPDAVDIVAKHMHDTGLVTVDGLTSRQAVLAFAARCLDLIPHRDSEPDGLTVVRDTGHRAHQPGFAGLGNGALPAHTERSGIPAPPRLMLFVCEKPADEGGLIHLADGQAIHADLAQRHPDAVAAFSEPAAAFFGGGDGIFAPVFARSSGDRLTLRLRQDDLVRWHPLAQPHVAHLRAAIDRHQQSVALAAGQGYLLDNHRWLHGRDGFRGQRVCYRALGTSRFPLPVGFSPGTW